MKPPTTNLSKRVFKLESELAFDYLKVAEEVAAHGVKIVSFGIGQPDFRTPEPILEAAIEALKAGHTGYTATPGIPALRSAIAEHVSNFTGSDVKPEEVIVTTGSKPAIYFSMMSFIEEGDEVIIPDPGYPTYESVVRYAGGTPIFSPLREEDDFRMTPESVEKAVTKKTKMIVLNSPENPTGGVNLRKDVEGILDIAKKKRIIVLTDEIYDHYVYDGEHISALSDNPDWRENLIYVNGFSKTYSMTGWRLGYAVARKEVIDRFELMASNTTSCPNNFVQHAGITALTMSQNFFKEILSEYRRRRDRIYEGLNRIHGIKVNKPRGAFYIFPNVEKLLKEKGLSASEFTMAILRERGLVTLPGTPAFSPSAGKDYLRLSYALPVEKIEEGLKRLGD